MSAGRTLRSQQLDGITRMLELGRAAERGRAWQDPWKVLVYDSFCRDIISPLLKVSELRSRGVTLHLLIESEREQISDAPAVYFVQPTAANIRRIADDCARSLYESVHVHFTPAVPRSLLETLAQSTVESNSVGLVSRLTDQYLNFVSLEDDFFSLQLSGLHATLYDASSTDAQVEEAAEAIAGALFSVSVTMGAVPLIRYAKRGAAQMVAEKLARRLYDQLRAHPELFRTDASSASLQRPLLVLVDRSADVCVMVQHAWSYCALCHDLLDMKLSRVSIKADDASTQTRSYDLHSGDSFWAEHMGTAFQQVASEVDARLGEYRAAMDAINASGAAQQGELAPESLTGATRALQSTLSALPELQEKKRLIDAHMNIATELLSHIKARSLDEFYSIEETLMADRSGLTKEERATLTQLLTNGGTPEDRLRLLLLVHLHPCGLSAPELATLATLARESGANLSPLAPFQRLGTLESSRGHGAAAAAEGTRLGAGLMSIADKVGVGNAARNVSAISAGVGSLAATALASGLKQLMTSRRETPVTRAVAALVDNKPATPEDDAFGFLDPKLGAAAAASDPGARSRTPYAQAICFVVGAGNYLEYEILKQRVTPGAQPGVGRRRVVYGCTEVMSASAFLEQLK